MKIDELTVKLLKLNDDIKDIMKKSSYTDYDDLSALEQYDSIKQNPNSLQLLDEYMTLLYKLQDVTDTMEYFKRPIKSEGYLSKQSNGRYALDGKELSSGYGIEWLCTNDDRYYNYDADTCCSYWRVGRIEHNGTDYYIVGCKEDIGTVRVRLRG